MNTRDQRPFILRQSILVLALLSSVLAAKRAGACEFTDGGLGGMLYCGQSYGEISPHVHFCTCWGDTGNKQIECFEGDTTGQWADCPNLPWKLDQSFSCDRPGEYVFGDMTMCGGACGKDADCSDPICGQERCEYSGGDPFAGGPWSTQCNTAGPKSSCDGNQETKPLTCKKGDPVSINAAMSIFNASDAELKTSLGTVSFDRTFVSSDRKWALDQMLGSSTDPYLPRPFGASPTNAASLQWSHNFYSFVSPKGWSFGSSIWAVRTVEGELLEFTACTNWAPGTTPCFATPGPRSRSGYQLYWSPGSPDSFTLYAPSGLRYVYAAMWNQSGDTHPNRYFLSRIESGQYPAAGGQARVIATVNYAAPLNSGDSPIPEGCPGQSFSGTPGAPYISNITTVNGTKLLLRYESLPTTSGTPAHECVLSTVKTQDIASPPTTTWVAQYTYYQHAGAETSGLLVSTHYPERSSGQDETYGYVDNSSAPGFWVSQAGPPETFHSIDAAGWTVAQSGPYESFTLADAGSTTCGTSYNASYCLSGNTQQQRVLTDSAARTGGGYGNAASFSTTYRLISTNFERANRLDGISSNGGGLALNDQIVWGEANGGAKQVVVKAMQDTHGGWSISALAPAAGTGFQAAGLPTPLEKQAKLSGATNPDDGGGALEKTYFTYDYGSQGQTPTAYEQLLTSQGQDSGMPGSTVGAVTYYQWDTSTNRLKAVIREGSTEVLDTSTYHWTTQARRIGTFYRTATCDNPSNPDPLGRVVEIVGPCLVDPVAPINTITGCNSTGPWPVTRYTYNTSSIYPNDVGRLYSVDKYANPSAACPGATDYKITTVYSNYDVRGNPGQVYYAYGTGNQVTTWYSYNQGRVSQVDVGINSGVRRTKFFYDHDKLVATQFPDQSYEVNCYQTNTTAGCTGGTWTEKIQWKAKSTDQSGAGWYEKVAYAYWPDGTLRSETYSDATGVRRVVNFESDPNRMPTWNSLGTNGLAPSAPVHAARLFDGAENLIGTGLAYNSPTSLCGGTDTDGTPLSPLCAAFTYDRAERLTTVKNYMNGSTKATATFFYTTTFGYDVHGNINLAQMPVDGSPNNPIAGPTYQWDDFGNVVEAFAPWSGTGGSGGMTTHYEYGALGNVVRVQAPDMLMADGGAEWLEYTYDALGRNQLEARHWQQGGYENLKQFFYEGGPMPNCSLPSPSYNTGKLAFQVDSFGITGFVHNPWGEVTHEYKVRGSYLNGPWNGTCDFTSPPANWNTTPNTDYVYDGYGRLTSINYPYGRTVSFTYKTSTAPDRLDSISATTNNGTAWGTSTTLIDNIAWEPYGGLRGYQIEQPGGGTTAVEYLLGDTSSPVGTCSTGLGTNDATGLVRALSVSVGPFSPGAPASNVYKQVYSYQGNLLKESDSCITTMGNPMVETYGYDRLARLVSATGDLAVHGGAFSSRSYAWDSRGRQMLMGADADTFYNQFDTTHVDWQRTSLKGVPNSLLGYDYLYWKNGAVGQKSNQGDSGGASYIMSLLGGMNPTTGSGLSSGTGATDTVFRAIGINGAYNNYFYDARGRRRLKVNSLSVADEYFYTNDNHLIVDIGNDSSSSPTKHPIDEYIWLDGRPVVMIRGQDTLTWTRNSDLSGPCSRNGDNASCGIYFPVVDRIGKPVVMLDSARRIAGTGEYDPFGAVNRVTQRVETAHPYPTFTSPLTLGAFTQPVAAGLKVDMRFKIDLLDTRTCGTNDYIKFNDTTSGTSTPQYYGAHVTPGWSAWLTNTTAGQVQAKLYGNCAITNTRYGTVIEGYEYRRHDPAVNPIWTPLRFPGQYYDSETDLVQNWNRFYEPSSGRYLSPEAAYQNPKFVRARIKRGYSLPPYGYAANNPLLFSDANGLFPAPKDPSGLPEGWSQAPHGKDASNGGMTGRNGETKWVHESGEEIQFHPAVPGARPGTDGEFDHWHYWDEKGHKHTVWEGDEIPDPKPVCQDPAVPDKESPEEEEDEGAEGVKCMAAPPEVIYVPMHPYLVPGMEEFEVGFYPGEVLLPEEVPPAMIPEFAVP